MTQSLTLALATLLVTGGSIGQLGIRAHAAAGHREIAVDDSTVRVLQERRDPLIKQRTKGDPNAPLVMYEMSDFQCPACKAFNYETLPDLEREYVETGKLQIVFVNLPLVQIHPNAAAAHEFAMCAAQQDRFWSVHDLLFHYQEAWANSQEPAGFFLMIADSAGLEQETLMSCLETGELRWLVQQEATAVAQQGIRSTPSFIIERQMIQGYPPIEQWRPLLDSLYLAKTGGG